MVMKRTALIVLFILLTICVFCLATVTTYALDVKIKNTVHYPITQELIRLLEKDLYLKTLLEKSIAQAKKVNPDKVTNPVQSLQEYYDFIDKASKLLPQDILNYEDASLPERMQQGYCYFYFLINQPLEELAHMGKIRNSIQYYKPFAKWLYKFVETYGAFLNSSDSWNEKVFKQIYADTNFGLQKGWYESPKNWKTFNQFFARKLKSTKVRPIASPDDPSVVVSPADSVPQGIWMIDENSKIKAKDGVKVKADTFYTVEELLGKDSKYKHAFANGMLTHTYLNVFDYHRYHFPITGRVKEKKIIKMNVARQVKWDSKEKKYYVDHSLDWEFFQTRGYVILDTKKYGHVAVIPVGMGLVSSVNFEKNVRIGNYYNKGDKLGYFLFGGSDIIMLFQEKAGFEITVPMEAENTYKHILMGEKYGIMKGGDK